MPPFPKSELNRKSAGPFSRLSRAVRQFGLKVALLKIYVALVDRWFDWRYGVETCSWADLDELSITGGNKGHGHRYEPGRIVVFRRLFQQIRQVLTGDLNVVDLGSGKGRVLLMAAEFGAAEATGVEFAHELCEVAQENCRRYALKTGCTTRFEVVESDVVNYVIRPTENVFIFFNPFDAVVMRTMIDKIETSLNQHPRPILICYYTPLFGDVITAYSTFRILVSPEFRGYQFTIYANS